MPTNRRILSQDAAVAAGDADADQNLVARIDANDEDSVESGGANTGAAGTTIFDIAKHDLNVPLVDKASNLQFHLNFSDTSSYAGTGTTFNDISGNNVTITPNAQVTASDFGQDLGGYFNVLANTTNEIWTIPHSNDTHVSSTNGFTYEYWLYFDTAGNDTHQFYLKGDNDSSYDTFFYLHEGVGWYFQINGLSHFIHNDDKLLDQYVHVAFTLSSNNNPTQKLYINGTLVKTVSATGTISNTSSYDTNIGAVLGNNNDIYGRIGAVRLYNTALTASEVAQNFRNGRNFSYSSIYSTNLQANLDAGDTTTLTASTWSDKANSNNGTFNNFSSTLSDFYDKELGNWIDFDGTNDYLQIPASTNLDIGSGGFTYETWLLNEKSSGTSSVISNTFNVSGFTGYTLRIVNGTDVTLFIYNNEAIIFNQTASSSVTTNTWTHLAFTVASASSGAAVKLYINGILSSVSGTLSGAYGGSGQNIQAGQYPFAPSGRYFNGKMGVLKFHSEELTSAEIAQNYLATKNDYPNGHNGTLTSVSLQTGTPSYIDFTAGASGDYIDLGSTIPFSTQFSVTHWVNFHEFSTASQHLSSYYGGGNLYYFSISGSAGKLDFNVYGTGTTTQISGGDTQNIVLNTTEWQLVTATCDFNGTIKIYIDKTLSASKTNNATAPNTKTASDELYIGGLNNSPTYSMGADLGAFRFYDKELTSAEIDAIFDAEKATYGRS